MINTCITTEGGVMFLPIHVAGKARVGKSQLVVYPDSCLQNGAVDVSQDKEETEILRKTKLTVSPMTSHY